MPSKVWTVQNKIAIFGLFKTDKNTSCHINSQMNPSQEQIKMHWHLTKE